MQDDTLDTEVLAELYRVILDRRDEPKEDSYTSSLLEDPDEDAVLEKLGEETTELLLAGKDGDPDELAHEAADVVYHMMVLFADRDVSLELLLDELRDRRS